MLPTTSRARRAAPPAPAALLLVALALGGIGCGASAAEVREARTSGYDADFTVVYNAALAAIRDLYPEVTENPSVGVIKTAWHPLRIREGAEDTRAGAQPQSESDPPPPGGLGVGRQGDHSIFFIRFEVHVIGGRPWRVRIHSEASRWRVGEVPTPLRGAEVPHWLEGREDALRLKIHKRLREHAVELRFEKREESKPKPVVADLGAEQIGDVPEDAAKVVAETHRAAVTRDATKLRELMADEFTWSRGGDAPSADVAVAMWQADGTLLGEMARVLESGCLADDAQTLVTCPPASSQEPAYRGFRAGFRLLGDAWKLSFFYADD